MPICLLQKSLLLFLQIILIIAVFMTKQTTKSRLVRLKLIHTSDVHGNYFTRDFVNDKPVRGGLSRVYAYVQSLRRTCGQRLLLMDGGDMLQGSPAIYYSNFIASEEEHLGAGLMNYMKYDVGVIGNHDIETGHAVYDRWIRSCHFPILGANVIDSHTGMPYLKPYEVFERDGIRLAVMGMTSPAVPNWLPPELWSGLRFEEMVSCAEKWMKVIREKENPDVVVGLFHSGKQDGIVTPDYAENAAFDVARQVAGFDVVCYGHDHARNCETIVNNAGEMVLCCAPSSLGTSVSEIDLELELEGDAVVGKTVKGQVTDVSRFKSDEVYYLQHYFKRPIRNVQYYVNQRIGMFAHEITCEDAYFGPSAFVDLIHTVQLKVTGAQVSFAAPLSFDAKIKGGDVHIRDMFNLYRYENVLYVMRFTGKEIKNILEMSYALWTSQMKSADDHIMNVDYLLDGGQRLGFVNLAYNFDSAAGIIYEVDVSKPEGEKILIKSFADGTPFEYDQFYLVATNSYRGNGGGELFTKGAGILHDQLASRIVLSTEKDLRHYLIDYISECGIVDARPLNQWHFVPEEWADEACRRDRGALFVRRQTTKEPPSAIVGDKQQTES